MIGCQTIARRLRCRRHNLRDRIAARREVHAIPAVNCDDRVRADREKGCGEGGDTT